MRRMIWGALYCLVGAGVIASIALLCRSVTTDNEPIGLAGVAMCVATVFVGRLIQDGHWLKSARAKIDADREAVHEGKMAVQAKAALIENDIHRATRELEAAQIDAQAQLAAEREEMLADVETRIEAYRREGFEIGFMAGVRGITHAAPEEATEGAKVIRLPLAENQSTTMDPGALYN
jgi:hypothetical protein